MVLYRDEAIVLRTYKLGEADRIVNFYSRGRGKIRAVAKGVRRTKSKFGSLLEPASIVSLQLYEGRNLDIVTQAERKVPLVAARSDLELFSKLSTVLEVVDQIGIEGESNTALYKLTVGAATELDRTKNGLVVTAFIAKMLTLEGVQPVVDRCVVCGIAGPLVAFALHEGGTLCGACRRGHQLSDEARRCLAAIFQGRVRHVLDTTPPDVALELQTLSAGIVEQHLERRLKSQDVLNNVK